MTEPTQEAMDIWVKARTIYQETPRPYPSAANEAAAAIIQVALDTAYAQAVDAAVNGMLPRHWFWGAGELDCPPNIKAGNGELHTLLCKNCGQENPSRDICLKGKPL